MQGQAVTRAPLARGDGGYTLTRKPEPRVTPATLGWFAGDPDRLTVDEIAGEMELWEPSFKAAANKALKRTKRGEFMDYYNAAAMGFYEGLLRFQRSATDGKPSSYATWWLKNRVRDEVRRHANRGVYVQGRGVEHCVTLFGELHQDTGDDRAWEHAISERPGPTPTLTRGERERFWAELRAVLTVRQFEVIELMYRYKRSSRDIAIAFGVTHAAIDQSGYAALERLRLHAARFRGFAEAWFDILTDTNTGSASNATAAHVPPVDKSRARQAPITARHPGAGHAHRGRAARAALIERARRLRGEGLVIHRPGHGQELLSEPA